MGRSLQIELTTFPFMDLVSILAPLSSLTLLAPVWCMSVVSKKTASLLSVIYGPYDVCTSVCVCVCVCVCGRGRGWVGVVSELEHCKSLLCGQGEHCISMQYM